MPSLTTINYVVPPRGYFWAWSEDCALEWEDQTTVAVWEEIDRILLGVSSKGLPPLGAIVLILAACGEAWPRRWQQVRHLAAASTGESEPLRTTERLLRPVEAGLQSVHALPSDLRRGVNARCGLIEAIFEGVFNRLPPVVADDIISELKREGLGFRRREKPDLGIHMRLLRDLSALDAAFAKLDLARLEERLRTGIDARSVSPATLPPLEPSGLSELPLLEQLARQEDAELSAIATLARRVIAMISVPRLPGQMQSLPVGGISDISNRGDLTRLLLGELAWDDEMFSARLAHSEALYYRREYPPDAPRSVRSILLDHGIRLWGLPRVYALAVTLALSTQAKTSKTDVATSRREGAAFRPLALESVQDVQAHLAALSPSVCPVDALNAWLPADATDQQHDVFVIAEKETLQSLKTAAALKDLMTRAKGRMRLYTIHVDRGGNLEVVQHTGAGQRVVAKCRLDLDALLAAPPSKVTRSELHLPSRRLYSIDQKIARLAFYQHWPLPMKFPAMPGHAQQMNRAWENQIVAVDTERRLMAWPEVPGWATELAAGLPKSRDYWVDPAPGAFFSVVCSALEAGERVKLCRQRRSAEPPEIIELKSKHSFPRFVTFSGGAAILHYLSEAEAFSLSTGLRVAEIDFVPTIAMEVSFDGDQLRLEPPAAGDAPAILPISDLKSKTAQRVETIPPSFLCLVDDKIALAWENECRVWSSMARRFETFKRTPPARVTFPFTEVPGTSHSNNAIPAFWHAHSSAADFYYDSRGILHIVTEEAQVAISIHAMPAAEVWTDPPKSGRKTIADVEQRLQVLAALK